MHLKKGIIALDIDGTVTAELLTVPLPVVNYLKRIQTEGWEIIFLTGRTFSFAEPILKHFTFSYFVAVQNGADILEMPGRHLLYRNYLPSETIGQIETATQGQKEDFVIYAGYEKGDFCYYRSRKCSPRLLEYFKRLQKLCHEPWQDVASFFFLNHFAFPLIKCFGDENDMKHLNQRLKTLSHIHATMIQDPVDPSLFLNLVTDAKATKGEALKQLKELKESSSLPIIAAGDDRNDLAMFACANVSIAMQTAPQEVLDQADMIAKSAKENGIIDALTQALLAF